MKRRLQFSFASFLFVALAEAQTVADSLWHELMHDSARIYRYTPVRPYGRLENRYSFLNSNPVNFHGFLAGVYLHEYHIVAAGYYFLTMPSRERVLVPATEKLVELSRVEFTNFTYQFIFLSTRYLQLQLPLEAGYGFYRMRVADASKSKSFNDLPFESGKFIPLGAGMQFIIRPIRGAGMSLITGYRYSKQESISLQFNGIYYAFGIWADLRQLYRDVRYYRRKKRTRDAIKSVQTQNTQQSNRNFEE